MTIKRVILKRIIQRQVRHFLYNFGSRWNRRQDNLEVIKTSGELQSLVRPFSISPCLNANRNRKMPPTEQNEADIWDSNSTKKDVIQAGDISRQPADDEPIWVFGYGSLIWKTNFPYTKKISGFIKGFTRRFWQGSTDHRGVPGKPGRVVTLIPREQEITWGIAYQVLPASVPEVMAYLNHREKGGYTLHSVNFYPKDENVITFSVYVYIATESNEEFLGDAPMADIAKQIAWSRGPSGDNSEYLLQLAKAVREIGVNDDHLFELEKRVSELIDNRLKIVVKESDIKELYPLNKNIIMIERETERQD